MKTIKNVSFDPFYNLALEEFLLKQNTITDDLFFLWRNKESVVIGRNQNPYNEVDIAYAKKNNIDIVRRGTGGGTVYHDKGNINFTYVTSKIKNRLHNYEYFLSPIITILNHLGIQAKFTPKTHIFVGEHKVSGNAQVLHKNRMIHHGTLLFDVNSEHLQKVLKKKEMIETYAIGSQRSLVLNLKDIFSVELDSEQFMGYILEQMGIENSDIIELSEKQHKEIDDLAKSKYHKWEWTFGQTPKFKINKSGFTFEINKCIITKSSHYKDLLVGQKFDREIISKLLHKNIDKDKLINILFT